MRRVSTAAAIFVALCFSNPTPLLGQEQSTVSPGERVRVKAPDYSPGWLGGTLVEMTGDSCVLAVEGEEAPSAIPVRSITRMEVLQGKKSAALRGALIGFASAVVFVYWPFSEYRSDEDLRPLAVLILGPIAAGLGAVVGHQFKVDRWDAVPLDQVQVRVVPRPAGRIAFGLAIRH